MTTLEKLRVQTSRQCMAESAEKIVDLLAHGEHARAETEARIYRLHRQSLISVVSDAHCADCGAHQSEACAADCGYDGPTASGAMADS